MLFLPLEMFSERDLGLILQVDKSKGFMPTSTNISSLSYNAIKYLPLYNLFTPIPILHFYWLVEQGSNLRMLQSKCNALPLGYLPIYADIFGCLLTIIKLIFIFRNLFSTCFLFNIFCCVYFLDWFLFSYDFLISLKHFLSKLFVCYVFCAKPNVYTL